MAATTRGYRHPIGSDDPDVTADMANLANDIDADVQKTSDAAFIRQRIARIAGILGSGTTLQPILVPFTHTRFDVAGKTLKMSMDWAWAVNAGNSGAGFGDTGNQVLIKLSTITTVAGSGAMTYTTGTDILAGTIPLGFLAGGTHSQDSEAPIDASTLVGPLLLTASLGHVEGTARVDVTAHVDLLYT